jgi:hypothetical protein
MTKIIFLLWLLSGKVQTQYDTYGYKDFNDGRELYTIEVSETVTRTHAYKGEILNFIRTGVWQDNEDFSDNNGRITEPEMPVDTLYYKYKGVDKAFEVYGKGKKQYIIDDYLKCKVYIYKK